MQNKETAVVAVGVQEAAMTSRGLQVKKLAAFATLGKAGVKAGDVIVSCNGQRPQCTETLAAILTSIGIGNTLTVQIERQGQALELSGKVLQKKSLNLNVEKLDEALERKISPA